MANQQAPTDSIVRKIQLLLNLGQRSEGNEAEAAAAMSKAQELLAQYNLDLATVQDASVPGGTNPAEEKRDYNRSKRSAMYKWQQRLVRTLAEANYCAYWVEEVNEEAYVSPGRRKYGYTGTIRVKRHKVLGRVANTTAVMIMTDYLLETIERLLPYATKDRLSRDANHWREGCADRLVERINWKAEAMRTADYAAQGEAAYSTAIMVGDLAKKEESANYDFMYGAGAFARRAARQAAHDATYTDEYWAKRAEEQEQKRLEALAAETPAQRKARERREAAEQRRNERYWEAQDRKAAREESKRYTSAYHAGRAKGGEIGLDTQLNKGKSPERIS